MSDKKKILMVCLGNTCRSPIAEGVFSKTVKERGEESKWFIDSAAIGPWHVGKTPNYRAQDTMKKHNVPYDNHAKQIVKPDFNEYDYIFGMDDRIISELNYNAPANCKAKILLLGDYDPEGERQIRDPYFDKDAAGFEKCYEQCVRCCNGFINKFKEQSD